MVIFRTLDYVWLGLSSLLLICLSLLVIRSLYAVYKGIRSTESVGQVLRERLVNGKTLVCVSVCVFLYLAILAMLPFAQYSKETLTRTGRPAAGFAATDMNGNLIRLSDLRGKCVLLDFWATACGPCRMDTPDLKTLQ